MQMPRLMCGLLPQPCRGARAAGRQHYERGGAGRGGRQRRRGALWQRVGGRWSPQPHQRAGACRPGRRRRQPRRGGRPQGLGPGRGPRRAQARQPLQAAERADAGRAAGHRRPGAARDPHAGRHQPVRRRCQRACARSSAWHALPGGEHVGARAWSGGEHRSRGARPAAQTLHAGRMEGARAICQSAAMPQDPCLECSEASAACTAERTTDPALLEKPWSCVGIWAPLRSAAYACDGGTGAVQAGVRAGGGLRAGAPPARAPARRHHAGVKSSEHVLKSLEYAGRPHDIHPHALGSLAAESIALQLRAARRICVPFACMGRKWARVQTSSAWALAMH